MSESIVLDNSIKKLVLKLESNDSASSLKELILKNDNKLELKFSSYGDFEHLALLGKKLPSQDKYIKTKVGDVMLYQGDTIVIFHQSNSWSYTPIGRIEASSTQLIEFFRSKTIRLSVVTSTN